MNELIKFVFKNHSPRLVLEYNNFGGNYRNFEYNRFCHYMTFNDNIEIHNYDNKLLCRIDKNNILNVREI